MVFSHATGSSGGVAALECAWSFKSRCDGVQVDGSRYTAEGCRCSGWRRFLLRGSLRAGSPRRATRAVGRATLRGTARACSQVRPACVVAAGAELRGSGQVRHGVQDFRRRRSFSAKIVRGGNASCVRDLKTPAGGRVAIGGATAAPDCRSRPCPCDSARRCPGCHHAAAMGGTHSRIDAPPLQG